MMNRELSIESEPTTREDEDPPTPEINEKVRFLVLWRVDVDCSCRITHEKES